MEEKQIRLVQLFVTIIAFICLIALFGYIVNYKDELLTNPCDFIANHSKYRCVVNPEEYICACHKYYRIATINELNISKLLENVTTEYEGDTNG